MLMHIVNGQVMSVVVDDDTKARAMSGLLGFQIHVGDADEGGIPQYLAEDVIVCCI